MAVLQLLSMIRDTCIQEDLSIWPVVYVFGSMSGVPMEVAIALALVVAYAQPNTTLSGRMFLTFHKEPHMCRLPPIFGEDAVELARVTLSLRNKLAGLNTNFSRSMDLMLDELVRKSFSLICTCNTGFLCSEQRIFTSVVYKPSTKQTRCRCDLCYWFVYLQEHALYFL